MKRLLFFIVLGFFTVTTLIAGNRLSSKAEFYLLNAAPGDELYEIFGHSAMRLVDDSTNTDIVFNYGLFSFTSENFIWCFMQGLTDYQLGVQRFDSFIYYYQNSLTSVWQQRLNLSPVAKQKLYDALAENYKIENRFYRYNYFFDNCATRLRDQIAKNAGSNLLFKSHKAYTFRQLVNMHTQTWPWTRVGIGILLGWQADRSATLNETMFLPMFLRDRFAEATNTNGQLVCPETQTVIDGTKFPGEDIKWSPLALPFAVLLALVLFVILRVEKSSRVIWVSRSVWLFLTGAVGVLVVFFWFFSIHPGLRPNINVLWAMPLNIVAAGFYLGRTVKPWMQLYKKVASGFILLFLILVVLRVQTVPFEGIVAALITLVLLQSERLKKLAGK